MIKSCENFCKQWLVDGVAYIFAKAFPLPMKQAIVIVHWSLNIVL